jgi:hypothetical protein
VPPPILNAALNISAWVDLRRSLRSDALHSTSPINMHSVFEAAGRMLGIAYAAYMAIIGLAGVFGLHVIALSALVWLN